VWLTACYTKPSFSALNNIEGKKKKEREKKCKKDKSVDQWSHFLAFPINPFVSRSHSYISFASCCESRLMRTKVSERRTNSPPTYNNRHHITTIIMPLCSNTYVRFRTSKLTAAQLLLCEVARRSEKVKENCQVLLLLFSVKQYIWWQFLLNLLLLLLSLSIYLCM